MLKGLKEAGATISGTGTLGEPFERIVWTACNRSGAARSAGDLVAFDWRGIAASTSVANKRTGNFNPRVLGISAGREMNGGFFNFIHPSQAGVSSSFSMASGATSYSVDPHGMTGAGTHFVYGLVLESIAADQEGDVLIIGTYASCPVSSVNASTTTLTVWDRLGTQYIGSSTAQNATLRPMHGTGSSFEATNRAPVLAMTLASVSFTASTASNTVNVFFDGWNKFTQKGN